VDLDVIAMVRKVITQTHKPSWVRGLPHNFGSAAAGTPKADEWRMLYLYYLPIALIVLWGSHGQGTKIDDRVHQVLRHTMHLVIAICIACRHTMTRELASQYLDHYKIYVRDLAGLYPGVAAVPNMHVAFHIYDFLLLFGPVRSWWTFPFERLVGLIQKLLSNHIMGTVLMIPLDRI
jgi:hypothetical protein